MFFHSFVLCCYVFLWVIPFFKKNKTTNFNKAKEKIKIASSFFQSLQVQVTQNESKWAEGDLAWLLSLSIDSHAASHFVITIDEQHFSPKIANQGKRKTLVGKDAHTESKKEGTYQIMCYLQSYFPHYG